MQINFKAYTGSMNDGVSPLIHPAEQPELLLGCTNSYKIGKITKDTGYSEVQTAAQAGKSIGGLYHFRQSPTVKKMLKTVDDATSDDTQLFYSDTGAWTEIAAAESAWQGFAGAKVEMETFIGYCFLVGHSAADGYLPSASLTNTTFSTSTNVTNMPRAKYIAKWDSKIFIANCRQGSTDHPYRVYYSSIPEAGAITWTVATDFFDLPDFSDEITGIVEMWNKLIIFTEYKTYFYDGSSLIKTPWQMGCSSHRTIQKHGNYLVWANVDGVWVSTGGQPQNIIGEIEEFFRAAAPLTLFAEIVDEQYFLYLGNVNVRDTAYVNLTAVFDIGKSLWWLREFADTMTIFAERNVAGKRRLYMGTSGGKVMDKGKYTDDTLVSDDDGSNISSTFILPPIHVEALQNVKKILNLTAFAERAGGLKLKARIIDRNNRIATDFEEIGELTKYVETFELDVSDGVLLQIMGVENGNKPYWIFLGHDLGVEPYGRIIK